MLRARQQAVNQLLTTAPTLERLLAQGAAANDVPRLSRPLLHCFGDVREDPHNSRKLDAKLLGRLILAVYLTIKYPHLSLFPSSCVP